MKETTIIQLLDIIDNYSNLDWCYDELKEALSEYRNTILVD